MDHTLLIHVGYVLMLFALLARDILWLRAILVCAQSNLALYALFHELPDMAAWNALFVLINAVWVLRILQERRAVQLPAELQPIHAQHFAALGPPEFLRIWGMGERRTLRDELLAREGETPASLYFVLAGDVAVEHRSLPIARLGAGDFVAEMSLLTGEAATADARALGEVQAMSWPTARLLEVRARNPGLWARFQSALGHDIVEKLKRQSRARAAVPPTSAA